MPVAVVGRLIVVVGVVERADGAGQHEGAEHPDDNTGCDQQRHVGRLDVVQRRARQAESHGNAGNGQQEGTLCTFVHQPCLINGVCVIGPRFPLSR